MGLILIGFLCLLILIALARHEPQTVIATTREKTEIIPEFGPPRDGKQTIYISGYRSGHIQEKDGVWEAYNLAGYKHGEGQNAMEAAKELVQSFLVEKPGQM